MIKDGLVPMEAVYEDRDTAVGNKFQPSFAQSKEVRTADNVVYFTQLHVLHDKGLKTQDNVAYN